MDNEDDGCSEILKFKLRKDQQAGKIEEKKKDEEISFEMLIQKSIITNQEKIVNAFNNQTSLSLKSTNDTKPEEKKTQSSSTSQKSIENSQPSVASKSKLQENFFEVKKKEAPSTKRKTISEHIAENPAKIPAEVMNKYNILIGCKFCDLIHIHKEKLIYEDDKAAAFHDKRKSSAKEHILVCPKNHLKNTATLTREDVPILVHLEEVGKKLLTQLRPNDEYR
jgi:Diadenosine tetraphosphate (Ap4A) hydrolase and other HIT family hydrolases